MMRSLAYTNRRAQRSMVLMAAPSSSLSVSSATGTRLECYQLRWNGSSNSPNGAAGSTNSQQQQQQEKLTEGSSSAGTSDGAANVSLFAVLREELGKLFSFVAHDVSKTAEASAQSLKSYKDTMTDANMTEEEKERRRKKEEAYRTIMAKNAAKAKEAEAAKTANMTWSEKLQHTMQQMKQATSKKAGVAALVQHCAAAHQAEVAVEQGIDVEDIQIVLEQVKAADGIGFETKVVGYIDAPKASEEQVYAYAERLKQKCPAANMMQAQMDWRKKPSSSSSSGGVDGEDRGTAAPLNGGGDGNTRHLNFDDDAFDARSLRGGGDNFSSPGSLSGREFMRDGEAGGAVPSSSPYGASASSFPSSFKNRKHHSNYSSADVAHSTTLHSKSGFDNPFEKLKILKEERSTGGATPQQQKGPDSSSSSPEGQQK